MKKIFVVFIVSLLLLGGIVVFAGEDDKDTVKTNMLETGAIMNIIEESW
ncbi:hypothetical protein [Petrotoga sp. 9PWA.NaAc.5.4]|nr:hypothetical protein [Petrotoga sp. 9PWA.NaAc.5.4]PNR96283.1 hypothetical protein X924_03140 [Petrotoga sp. 9PWA.NaAc.5.4]